MEEDLKKILEKNLELNAKIYDTVLYIKKYIFWQKIFGFLKLFIIVIPLIIGFIYLPPLLSTVFDQYKSVLQSSTNPTDILKNLNN